MKPNVLNALSVIALASSLAACVPAPRPATPPPPPTPLPSAHSPDPRIEVAPLSPAPPPQPVYDNWMDAPRTPGDWHYRGGPGGGIAAYAAQRGGALLTLRCDHAAHQVIITRSGTASAPVPMRIVTETASRVLNARPSPTASPTIEAQIPATDRFLEAMAFSKGRFAVETLGEPTLYLPSWAEVTRVIEDCR